MIAKFDIQQIRSKETLDHLKKHYAFYCDVKALKLHKNVSGEGSAEHWVMTDIYQCQDCKKFWKFRIEFDSQKGYAFACIQPNQETDHPDKDFKFETKEIEW